MYCAWVRGSWRVVSVQLQLGLQVVYLNDSAMWSKGGQLQGLKHLRELEVLCVKQRPKPTPPGDTGTEAQQGVGCVCVW